MKAGRRLGGWAVGLCGAALLSAYPPLRLSAQVSFRTSLGARYTSTLVHDYIVAPIDVRPALAPTLVLTAATPLRGGWTAQATLDVSTSELHRYDADGSSVALGRLHTASFTVGLERRLRAGFTAGLGVGGLKYLPSEDSGIFRLGSGPLAGLGTVTLGHALPLGAWHRLGVEARYDVHGFTTPALRAEGFDASRTVHRVTLTVRAAWGAAP